MLKSLRCVDTTWTAHPQKERREESVAEFLCLKDHTEKSVEEPHLLHVRGYQCPQMWKSNT